MDAVMCSQAVLIVHSGLGCLNVLVTLVGGVPPSPQSPALKVPLIGVAHRPSTQLLQVDCRVVHTTGYLEVPLLHFLQDAVRLILLQII